MPLSQTFLVRDIFTDFKRHDVGPGFYERNYDGTLRKEFLTTALWGVGTTAPYGHDGRSLNLTEVILRHGGDAQAARDAFASLGAQDRAAMLEFLNSLVLFPPDDTASNLDPGNPERLGLSAVRPRQHQAGRAVQRPERQGVGGRVGSRGSRRCARAVAAVNRRASTSSVRPGSSACSQTFSSRP